jgi:molybdenum cofactor biosynthesis enzyme MoaA
MSENMSFLPKADLLSLEELDRLCSAFVAKGVRKLRLTGGEPLVRRGIMTLFSSLSRHLKTGALDELTVTTNGSQLGKYAAELKVSASSASTSRSILSIPDKFRAITRWGDLKQVLAGIDAAQAAGLKVKINAVALKGVNEDELPDLVAWAHGPRHGHHHHRGDAARRHRRRPARAISAAVDRALAPRHALLDGRTSTTTPVARRAMCASRKPAAGSASSRR